MENKVLLSIKPEYVNKIFLEEKLYEYRRLIFKKKVETVVIYATSPIKKIVGEFKIVEILHETPERIWEITKDKSGIEKEKFFKYFNNLEKGYAIKIKEIKKYKDPLELVEFNIKAAPQSFVYLK